MSIYSLHFYGSKKDLQLIVVVVVQSLSRVQLFVTLWTAAHQACLSFTISLSLLKLMSIESVMPSNHLILFCPLLPSLFPSNRVFSNESALHSRWPKYWSFGVSEFHNFWLSLPECRKMHPIEWAGIIWFLLILFVLQLNPYRYASMLIIQFTIWNSWKF